MTATITAAADLLNDPEFLSLCDWWKDNGRCPIVMPDWLRDKGLWTEALTAEWAVSEPERPVFSYDGFKRTPTASIGPTPRYRSNCKCWSWYVRYYGDIYDADDLIREQCLCADRVTTETETFAEAITLLLDYYRPESQ